MTRPKDKGTMAESAVVAYLRDHGFPYAERRSLNGALDKGDVTGTPGLCWEVKYANAGLRLSSWMAETAVEKLNSFADHGILVIKPSSLGVKSVHRWYAAMALDDHDELIKKAGAEDHIMMLAPFSYTAGNLAVALVRARTVALQWGHVNIESLVDQVRFQDPASRFVAVTAIPPGCKDRPSMHYRVMHLEEMVRLLRQAGYGTPHEDPLGVSRE